MTKLIVGLGNPGPRYSHTRHNAGFAVIVELSERLKVRGRERNRLAIVGEGEIDGEPVALAQPLTMMNLSGRAVSYLRRTYNIHELSNLLIVYDEMDLPLGTLRVRAQGSAGGHNGIKSIIDAVQSQEFPRLRVGVGRPAPGDDPVDHVLTRFRPEEKAVMEKVIPVAADAVEFWVRSGTDETMNRFNRWRLPLPPDDGPSGETPPPGPS